MMNEKLLLEVFIDGEHNLGQNKYARGRIHGMMTMVCETYGSVSFPNEQYQAGVIMQNYCTIEEYAKLRERLNRDYPGLCKINVCKADV